MVGELDILTEWIPEQMQPGTIFVLENAGQLIMQSVTSGVLKGATKRGGLFDTLTWITTQIPKHKGPPSRDRTLLTDAGESIMDGFLDGLESRYDVIRRSLTGFTSEIGAMGVAPVSVAGGAVSARLSGAIGESAGGTTNKTLNYYAAPGSSLGSEEDLWGALDTARGAGW